MRARRAEGLLVAAALALGGCVVTPLTDLVRPGLQRRAPARAIEPPVPQHALDAVRTSEGSYHALVRCADGSLRRLVVETAPADQVGSGAWPGLMGRVRLERDPSLPAGVPVRCQPGGLGGAARPDVDAEMTAVLGRLDAGGVLSIERGEVRLTPSGEAPVVLAGLAGLTARLRPQPTPRPPAERPRASQLACALLLPFAVAIDVALSGALTAVIVVTYPVLPGAVLAW